MQKQRLIALVAGLLLALVLALIAAVMTNNYIVEQRKAIAAAADKKVSQIQTELQANQAAVLVAKQDIPSGADIKPEMFDTAIIPNQFVQPKAVTSLGRIEGMVTVAPVAKGEQITLSKLAYAKQQQGKAGLAAVTPAGKRAITISVDNVGALVGMVKAGDYVDVIVTVAVPFQTADGKQASQLAVIPLFQNTLVLAVGQDIGGAEPKEEKRYAKEVKQDVSPLITLALTPQEAGLIAFLQEQQAKVRLVLRAPSDAQVQSLPPTSWETLFQYIAPKSAQGPGAEAGKEEAAVRYIEIYRGLNKEKIPLSKE